MPPSFAKGTLLNAAASVATILAGFVTTVIVARLLGPEAVGVLAYAAFIVTLSLAILDMGVPGMLMRFLPELEADGKPEDAAALVRTFLLPYLTASALFVAGLFWLLDPAAFHAADRPGQGRLIVALVAAAALAQSLAAFYYGMLKGRRQFSLLAKLTLISAVAQMAVAWIGAMLFGLAGALAAPVAGFALGAVLALRGLSFRSGLSEPIKARSLQFAWQTWGGYVLTTLAWSRMEIYFLKHSWGDHAAGLFAAGLNLANLALQTPMLLTGALIPFLVLKRMTDGEALFAQSYTQALRYFAMLVLPACFGAAAITPVLLPMIFGPAFAEAVLPAMILIAGASTITFFTIGQQYVLAAEKPRAVLWLAALGAGCSILSGLTLTPLYGTVGAAVGRLGAQAIVAAAMLAYIHHLGWRTPYRAIMSILAASLVSAAVAGLISQALPTAAGLTASIAAAALIYVLLCKYLRILTDDDLLQLEGLGAGKSAPRAVRATLTHTVSWLRR